MKVSFRLKRNLGFLEEGQVVKVEEGSYGHEHLLANSDLWEEIDNSKVVGVGQTVFLVDMDEKGEFDIWEMLFTGDRWEKGFLKEAIEAGTMYHTRKQAERAIQEMKHTMKFIRMRVYGEDR